MSTKETKVQKVFEFAKEEYAEIGVDVEKAMNALSKVQISMHCWQGDDVAGFDSDGVLDGGILVTGNYPGKATTIDELQADMVKMYSLLPGKHKLNLQSSYADLQGEKVDRNAYEPRHFKTWTDWAKANELGLDFNPTYFSHPKSDGFTLSSIDEGIRQFWIEHGIACRKIAESFGKELGQKCVTNFWMPDGYKDIPADKLAPRQRMAESLDKIFAEKIDKRYNVDAVESKLFGIGCESYTVASGEFALGYAAKNDKLLCLDAGHFHPTEVISDKISSTLLFVEELLLHVSRPVRWDSDHIVILNDELKNIAEEIVRGNFLNRVNVGLDFFDATINRLAAWVIGGRSMQKALLSAFLEPAAALKQFENEGDYTSRLATLEKLKTMPLGAVWDYHCMKSGVALESEWLGEVKQYEKDVLSKR